ncbi:MAG: Gamma-glutamylputrescine synthetase PuuA [Gammaproteobacteria bacterium]|nr:Gamma-glutamylputrescine synthetase PuuA [Gammaproteobacteria bacterium]
MNEIKDWLDKHGISEVECIVPDMAGTPRGKIMPAAKFADEQGMRLPEDALLQAVTGDYISDDLGVLDPADIDIVLSPDVKTLRLMPWAAEPTGQVIHDSFYKDGSPVEMAPRYVLQRVLKLYEEAGWKPIVAPELEFYLVKQNTDPDYPLEPPVGRSGRIESARQAYSIDALAEFDPFVDEVYDYCEEQGLAIDTLIHESGPAQMEINLFHGEPLELADQAFLFKRTVREVALRHNMFATFMAKPMEQQPGSSMHIHQSILDSATGKNIFNGPDGEASEVFFHYIGGLQKYLPAGLAILAPYVNSYRRAARYQAAPINLKWGYDNRTTGLRVPIGDTEARRVENRLAGADANPYLAIAVSLACGYLGTRERTAPGEPLKGSAYELDFDLPRTLAESLNQLNDAEPLRGLLGERFIAAYTAIKKIENEAFMSVISSWEREYLLWNV